VTELEGREELAPAVRHITATYWAASAAARAYGELWYKEAHALARELDPTNVERGAAVIAVLSPRVNWDLNVRLARLAYALHTSAGVVGQPHPSTPDEMARQLRGTLRASGRKAARILNGEDPYKVVGGPKVTAFWHAIVDPNSPDVVIDRHALDVATGQVNDDESRQLYLGRKGNYAKVARMYVHAARIISRKLGRTVTPCELQAATWVAWREMKKGS
jgi:hypothetical protein